MFVGETLARQDGATITCVRSPTVSAAHCRPKRKGGGFSHFAPLQAAPLNRRSNDIAFLEGSELDLFFFLQNFVYIFFLLILLRADRYSAFHMMRKFHSSNIPAL